MPTTCATERLIGSAGQLKLPEFGWGLSLFCAAKCDVYGLGEQKKQVMDKNGKRESERKRSSLSVTNRSCQQIPWGLHWEQYACVTSLYFPSCQLEFVEILNFGASSIDFTSVLFFLAKEAEPLFTILLFPIFVTHGNTTTIPWAGGDGRHRHGTAERPRTSGWVSWSCWNGVEDGTDPGAHFRLKRVNNFYYTSPLEPQHVNICDTVCIISIFK